MTVVARAGSVTLDRPGPRVLADSSQVVTGAAPLRPARDPEPVA